MADKKVLIADDSETIRQQVAAALEPAGFVVVGAADGIEALERVAESAFDLLIVDVNMPRLNGLDLLDRLQANAKSAKIPVLVLTTEVQSSLVDRAKKSGARAWMIKPVKPDQLVSVVKKLIG